jgi:hypothetical protein
MKPVKGSADVLAAKLRLNNPPIIGIIRNNAFCLDFRTIQSDELPEIVTALRGVIPK